MEGKRLKVKGIITHLIFMVLVIFFLPSTQSYYIRRNPYGSDVAQIQPPLIMPYVERRNAINYQAKDSLEDLQEDTDIPAVLSSLWDAGDDKLLDNQNDYWNLLKDTPDDGETVVRPANSREPLVDLPTGTPESVSDIRSSVINRSSFSHRTIISSL
jgi:hypothetical protein